MENINKKKNRFNIVDAIIILLIAALIFGIVYFIMFETGTLPSDEKKHATVVYTIRISDVDEAYLDSFAVGNNATNSSDLSNLGMISTVQNKNAIFYSSRAEKTADGVSYSIKQYEYEDKYDIYVTLTAQGIVDERGVVYIGSQRINVGVCVYIRCGNFASDSYVTDFRIE